MIVAWKCWISWWSTSFFAMLGLKSTVIGQIGYSVIEEIEIGTAVGNLVHDLQIDYGMLLNRKFQINFDTKTQYFDINRRNGILYIINRIDREELCGGRVICEIKLAIVMDMPLEVFQIQIQVLDMNDNSPSFPEDKSIFKIAESVLPGASFPLEAAYDPDVGSNALCSYDLSPNDFFTIETPSKDFRSRSLVLVLAQTLDREEQAAHLLTLTATDCGTPKRSGTTQIEIIVQDANDNPPMFTQSIYRVTIPENYVVGGLIVVVSATDMDEGENGAVRYLFSSITPLSIKQLFQIKEKSGEISLKGQLDYEERTSYEIQVKAKDNGQLVMTGHCKVVINITDVNDNAPEIRVTTLPGSVKEDSMPGFVIALFTVTDKDSGSNGQVVCQIPVNLPFYLDSMFTNYYSLVLKHALDRELVKEYNVPVTAVDGGFPKLFTVAYISFQVGDVNDNPPIFAESSYSFAIEENIHRGTVIFQVSALDPDQGKNAQITFSLLDSFVDGISVSHFISIHPDSGQIVSLNCFDYEKTQIVHFFIEVKDCGSPSLSNTVNITVFVQDQNDNSPEVLSPLPNSEMSLRSVKPGQIVSKVRAVDADSGYNALLSYQLHPLTNTTLFNIDFNTGDIRIARNIQTTEENTHKLVILVKDHGHPPKSTVAALLVSIMEASEETDEDHIVLVKHEHPTTGSNEYLIIAIAFIFSTLVFIVLFYSAFKFYLDFKNTDPLHRVEDFEYMISHN
ncbi:hypothetical protein GDO86_005306 [Hymenochirus boettgeri]|uniref:Cadherin domain-containing protein n=1 Tax=Hymenochirus boettgeri TaxID=247094 RepID=A0A8T2J5K1_9PIPI|nr:hypothetical protein GDO86_005306 [Hymenochirus boettgeri]